MKEFLYAVLMSALVYFLVGDARAEKLSEHNEIHTAIKAAQQALLADGCALAWPTRVKRYFVLREPEGIRITAKGYFLTCEPLTAKLKVTWEAPEITSAPIASYQIYLGTTADDITEVASVPADQLSTIITVDKAMVYVVMTSTDVNGVKSDYSPVARIEYVSE